MIRAREAILWPVKLAILPVTAAIALVSVKASGTNAHYYAHMQCYGAFIGANPDRLNAVLGRISARMDAHDARLWWALRLMPWPLSRLARK
jgi:hypothetical protein